jgi:hypothetical protein
MPLASSQVRDLYHSANMTDKELRKWDTPTSTDKAKLKEMVKMIRTTIKERRGKLDYLFEDRSKRVDGCAHCPKYFELTDSVNKIVEVMKTDPKYKDNVEMPVSLNKLKFMFYEIQSHTDDGTVKCNRYMDLKPDLTHTKLDGQVKLLAEDVFKFDGITHLQILDPNKDEIVYYYRGEGKQKDIIVQAILTKSGGTFRYFRYTPTEEELDPYDLPVLSEADMSPKEREEMKKMYAEIAKEERELEERLKPQIISTEELKIVETPSASLISKDKFDWEVDGKFAKNLLSLPKNTDIAKAVLSQGVLGTGLRVNAQSVFSLKGNEANANIQNEKGESYVEFSVKTEITGKTERKIAVPYSIRLGSETDVDALSVKGRVEDTNNNQVMTLELTDRVTQYIRSELRKDKNTNITTYAIAKDFTIGKAESMTVIAGKNEANKAFGALQHRKQISNNITMVLDVRVDSNRAASFYYNLQAKW